MPEMTPHPQPSQALPYVVPVTAAAAADDADCAFGCECATPHLQIDGWHADALPAAEPH